MFGPVHPTPYDLRFYAFGIPVRVHPLFWLLAGYLGFPTANYLARASGINVLIFLILWMLSVFVSILVHELGHALMARRFGWPPEIVLYYMGGLAMYQPTRGHTPQRSIRISAAGPGAGFLLYGVAWLCKYQLLPQLQLTRDAAILIDHTLISLLWINLWWGLLNLLPVLPLDGGRISQETCQLLNRRHGFRWALQIAIVTSGAAALYFLREQRMFGGLMFGYLCFQNFQQLQAHRRGY
ncbi:MAG: site-2 protease family protein [Planctomycetaceae bacterium]